MGYYDSLGVIIIICGGEGRIDVFPVIVDASDIHAPMWCLCHRRNCRGARGENIAIQRSSIGTSFNNHMLSLFRYHLVVIPCPYRWTADA